MYIAYFSIHITFFSLHTVDYLGTVWSFWLLLFGHVRKDQRSVCPRDLNFLKLRQDFCEGSTGKLWNFYSLVAISTHPDFLWTFQHCFFQSLSITLSPALFSSHIRSIVFYWILDYNYFSADLQSSLCKALLFGIVSVSSSHLVPPGYLVLSPQLCAPAMVYLASASRSCTLEIHSNCRAPHICFPSLRNQGLSLPDVQYIEQYCYIFFSILLLCFFYFFNYWHKWPFKRWPFAHLSSWN